MVRLRTEFLWVGVWPHERVICQIKELRTSFTSEGYVFTCLLFLLFYDRTDFCCVIQINVYVDYGFCLHTCVIKDNMLIKAPGRSIWSTPLNWGTGQRVSMLTVCLCPDVCLWIPEDCTGKFGYSEQLFLLLARGEFLEIWNLNRNYLLWYQLL